MKKLLGGLLVLVVVALAGVYVSLGTILKRGLETHGPRMLGAPVTAGVVTVSPFSGEGTIRGLRIGNPEGFTTPTAIEVGGIRVALDVKSLLGGGRILIKEIVVERPVITLETGPGGTNLQKLQKNLEGYAPSSPKEAEKTEGRKVEIARFRLTGARATAVVPQLKVAPQTVEVPDVELTGIGAKSGGATVADASKQILSAVTQSAVRSAGGVQAMMRKGLESLGGKDAAEKLESLKNLFKK